MPRRPDLVKAILWAGLICLGVFLSGWGWSRESPRTPVRLEEVTKAKSTSSPQSFHLAGRQASTGHQTRSEAPAAPTSASRSLSLRWLSGGFLGSVLCHYVYGYPLSHVWQEGPWPPGLLDILALAALCYLGYRLYLRLKRDDQPAEADPPPRFLRLEHEAPPPLSVTEEAKLGLAAIQEVDQDFDVQAFGEDVRLLLEELYAAWNREHLNSLNGKVKESLLEYLQMGLKIMSLREESSYLEELTLENITVTAAGVNDGKEFITVCFRGRLLDYVLDKSSGKLLLGSMAYPAIFQEYWDLERPQGQSVWVLQDIRES